MCGRYTLAQQQWIDSLLAGISDGSLDVIRGARFNVAPGQLVLAFRRAAESFEPAAMHWGLASTWPGGPSMLINARDDKLAESRFWKPLLERGRCAIAADGFYEWRKLEGGGKQPYWFSTADREPFAFAGLCRDEDQHGESCVIVTVAANELVAGVHDRMPAMLDGDALDRWLHGDVEEALAVLRPFPSVQMTARPVSHAVNRAANEGPELIEAEDRQADAPPAEPRLF